jgi:hypothetical protein
MAEALEARARLLGQLGDDLDRVDLARDVGQPPRRPSASVMNATM